MKTANATEEKPALSEIFTQLLNLHHTKDLSVGKITETIGKRSFGILLLLLSLPSALPVPAAGYSVPFGLIISLLGLQLVLGKTTPWLPKRVFNFKVQPSTAKKVFGAAHKIFGFAEALIRPRMHWLHHRVAKIIPGLLITLMGVLMVIPIPLTNTVPAIIVFFTAAGLTENDGLCLMCACIAGAMAILLYAVLIYILIDSLL